MTYEIKLSKTGRRHAGKYVALVDNDFAWLDDFSWQALVQKNLIYAVRTRQVDGKLGAILMHRFIWEHKFGSLDPKIFIDHKRHAENYADNRIINLRLATNSQNLANSKIRADNKSGFCGVRFTKDRGKWRAVLQYRGDKVHLGYYADAVDAALAYDVAAKKFQGSYARLNFPVDGNA